MSQSHIQLPARKAPTLQRLLNAYEINVRSAQPWRVQLVSAEDTSGRDLGHSDRAAVKNGLWQYYRRNKPLCRGQQHFVFDIAPHLYAIPTTWNLSDDASDGDFKFVTSHEINVDLDDPEHFSVVRCLLLEGFVRELKAGASSTLGALWRYYKDFCQVPDISRPADAYFCRRFGVDVTRLGNGMWVAQVVVGTQTVDGWSFGDYFAKRAAPDLADRIEAKRHNKRTRKNQPADVSVLRVQRVVGGQHWTADKFELSNPGQVLGVLRDNVKAPKLDRNSVLPCKCFGKDDELGIAASELRLVLDSAITGEDHRETIIDPQVRVELSATLRSIIAGSELFGATIELSAEPVEIDAFDHGAILPPAIRVRDSQGQQSIIPAPERITVPALKQRGFDRTDAIKRNGFLQDRGLHPLLACPASRFTQNRGRRLQEELNKLLDQRHLRFSFGTPLLYQDVQDIQGAVDSGEFDSVLLVLPEGKYAPQSFDSIHERAKRTLTVPSQCIQHDNTFSGDERRKIEAARGDVERYRRRVSDHYLNAIWGLAVKCHFVPFAPAESFNYNVHIGIDVGGRDNNKAVICVGYGFQNPRDRLLFYAQDLPLDGAKAEPIPVAPLRQGILDVLAKLAAKLAETGRQLDLTRTLLLRDGLLLGDGDSWNEKDAFAPLYREAVNRSWIRGQALWTVAEVNKSAEGWRPISIAGGVARNPMVGQWVAPFEDPRRFLLSTTGAPYLHQGTASPLLVQVGDIQGRCRPKDVLRDIVWEADMCFTKPDMGMKLPWVLYVANEGALQCSRAYEINGVPV